MPDADRRRADPFVGKGHATAAAPPGALFGGGGGMTRVAWGALLQGASEDIADWTEVLKPGFDHPWIETHGADTVLRSPVLDGLETASEVHQMAGALIDVLKGAVALSQGAGPLKCTGVAELSSDGKLDKYIFSSGDAELGRFRMHAVGVALGPDGKP